MTSPIVKQLEELNPVELEEIKGHKWGLAISDTGCWATLDEAVFRYYKHVEEALDHLEHFGIKPTKVVS